MCDRDRARVHDRQLSHFTRLWLLLESNTFGLNSQPRSIGLAIPKTSSTQRFRFANDLTSQTRAIQRLNASPAMSATSSNSQTTKLEAQSSKPVDENKSALPSLGALDEDDEFEEFDEQGE